MPLCASSASGITTCGITRCSFTACNIAVCKYHARCTLTLPVPVPRFFSIRSRAPCPVQLYPLSVSCQLSVVSCQLSVVSCQLSVVSCQLSIGRLSSLLCLSTTAVPVQPPARRPAVPTHLLCASMRVCVYVWASAQRGYLQAITLPHRSRPIVRPTSATNLDIRVGAVQGTGQVEEGRCSAERTTRRREPKGSIFPHGTGIWCVGQGRVNTTSIMYIY